MPITHNSLDSDYENRVVAFGATNFRNMQRKFGIKIKDRRSHMYIIGKTGVGKSTVLENMIVQDIRAGHGVAVTDPHGDLVEKIIKHIPSDRINDVIYFNPSDINYPFAFNVLEKVDKEHQHLVASGLIGVFRKIWADTWGPRLEYVLRNAILALLEFPDSTLLGIMRMLVDKDYRKKVVDKITDPMVRSFWVDEYEKYKGNFQVEAIAPIQNKVGAFLSSFLIRNVVGQIKSSIDLRKVMDEKKILLLNLSKGRIGEDNSSLLGAMMITKIQLAAMSRVDIPEADRNDFYMYIDEFQNFATESFADILSEARKYHLCMILAHQYREQLDERVQAAIFGNVGTLVVFRVGADDAEFLEKEFMPQFEMNDLVNLNKYNFYIKLMIDGITSTAFSGTGMPPLTGSPTEENLQKVINVSRERYCKKREVIEDKISRWSSMASNTAGESDGKSFTRPLDPDRPGFKTNCSRCGLEISVPFQPDGLRPVFCPDCLKLFKAGKISRESLQRSAVPSSSVPDLIVHEQPKELPPESGRDFLPPVTSTANEEEKKPVKSEGVSLEEALRQGVSQFTNRRPRE
ncbi:MAG: type IV secretion system DNA-binding domain-containing protein [Candidatus Komeilibacteria bacterium]|nr:type IV secretion system DNA-binding domain-containing protein [Candidatus Komeilibacteria bacterium]